MAIAKHEDDLPINMTQQEVADLFRVDIRTLKKWRATRNDFPKGIIVNSRTVLFSKEEIFDWIDQLRDASTDVYRD